MGTVAGLAQTTSADFAVAVSAAVELVEWGLPVASLTIHQGQSIHGVLDTREQAQEWAARLGSYMESPDRGRGTVHCSAHGVVGGVPVTAVAIVAQAPDEEAAWRSTWRCVAGTCSAEHHPYSGWEDAQAQMKRHAQEVAHDQRWPLTIALHDANGRQFSVTYVEASR